MKDDSDEADSDEEAEEEDTDNSNTWMVRSTWHLFRKELLFVIFILLIDSLNDCIWGFPA